MITLLKFVPFIAVCLTLLIIYFNLHSRSRVITIAVVFGIFTLVWSDVKRLIHPEFKPFTVEADNHRKGIIPVDDNVPLAPLNQ